ncbi:MAG: hypothetical protein RL292_396 [Candidatus Parcubacteria bacterium]
MFFSTGKLDFFAIYSMFSIEGSMPQKKQTEVPSFYCLVITPEEDGNHELVLQDGHRPSAHDIYEHHTTKSLLKRIRELDLDAIRARQNEEYRKAQRLARLRASPQKWL